MRSYYQKHFCRFTWISAWVLTAAVIFSGAALAQTTAFTYQGKLTDAGNPANGNYDLQFKLFDALSGGAQQGTTLVRTPVTASAGVFTVTLDFGANVFSGAARYLEIGVRPAGSGSAYTVLAPRQSVASSPYAIQTLNAQQLGGLPPSRFVQSDANGNVGIGLANPTTKLQVLQTTSGTTAIYGESATGRGVWGKSTSSKGVFGESTSLEGVQGISSTGSGVAGVSTGGVGVLGLSTSAAGVYGESAAINTVTSAAMFGKATGVGGTGVYGQALNTGGTGLYGESATGPGVYGKSTSSRGVFGESNSFIGVWGKSTSHRGVYGESVSDVGVLGFSISGSGIYGESAVSSLTAAGVYGKGTGSGSIGVIGEANVNNAVGLFGVSTSPTGFGVYARNLSGGRAILAEGNATQSLNKGGWVKAMVYVLENGNISRCYNSQLPDGGASLPPSGNTGCGFTSIRGCNGSGSGCVTSIDFGFKVDDRFWSATIEAGGHPHENRGINATNYSGFPNFISVTTFKTGEEIASDFFNPFMLIVY